MKSLAGLADILSSPRHIVITHHFNPDADALGSTLALYHYLNAKGHRCHVISPNAIPAFLMWLPSANDVLVYENDKMAATGLVKQADVLFSLDYNQYSRTQTMEPLLSGFAGTRVIIDHHLFPDDVFDYGLSDPAKSSTCEMVYDYITACGDTALIDERIASCLYAGVITDTGSFKFSCTTASVHRMVADLMGRGLKTTPVHEAIFDTFEENRLRFLGYVLSEKMQLFGQQHAALIPVTKEEQVRFQLRAGDTEGIVNYPLSMRNVIFSTFITEKDQEIRMSFRSKGSFDVNEFARTYFNGGGHANAAGGRSHESLQSTIDHFHHALQQVQNRLIQCYEESV